MKILPKMKRNSLIIVLLICLVAFCGCSMTLKPVNVSKNPNANKSKYTVYVSGAVATDGYVSVVVGSDIYAVLSKAGLLDCSQTPENSTALVTEQTSNIIVNYRQNNRTYYSVNVNGAAIIYRLNVENVSEEVVNKLADYISQNGPIGNRAKLREALGEDYENNFYKFYIEQKDYA